MIIQIYAHYVEFVQNAGLVHVFQDQREIVGMEAAMIVDHAVMDLVVPTPPEKTVRHLVFFQHKVAMLDLDVKGFRMRINQEHLERFVHAQMLLLTEMILAITL